MRSLRARLLVVLALVVLAAWAIWFGCQYQHMTRQQSGLLDRSLRSIAEQILLSLPGDIEASGASPRLRLPREAAALTGKFDNLHFQVWEVARGEGIVASSQAPAGPMRADFSDGYADVLVGGDPWRVFAVTDAEGRVQVQVGLDASARHHEIKRWAHTSLVTALAVLGGLALAVWLVVRWSLQPVLRVRQAMAKRETLDLAPLPGAGLPTEVRPLVDSFNALLQRLDHALQAERQFLSEAAHELRTPLAALLTQAQVALHSSSPAETREALDRLVRGIERASRLAQQLLDSARVESARGGEGHGPVDLAQVIAMVAQEFELVSARKRQRIALDAAPCVVQGDLDDLGILVRNLLDNALRYGREGGRVEIACRQRAGGGGVLEVRDDGPGVAEEERELIFERFFRGSNGNGERGSGIGLSLVARIARAHRAAVHALSGIDGRGFGVRLEFPPR
ncbi:ATP-binding protein [Luteimonas sp. RD2P54]|uniref:histidine kinase n=1 Tax=Luteimonas endophytica TaxID=3042023 RepID=A0ABT6J923_9GAMM|nr:ATP-binding protein [Luteimonas endophytica]MDH5823315.1 ATP-binding protein [Luteimonas endophytica]